MSGLGVLEKAGMLGPACQDSCLCPVSSTREERLGTPACPRAEAAGLEEWLRLQPSVGQRRGKEGTQGPPASLHKDTVFFLLAGEAWAQLPQSKPWQGPGTSSPEHRAPIALSSPYNGGLREGSTHGTVSPLAFSSPVPSEQKPVSPLLQPGAAARLWLRPWGQARF